MDLGSFDGPDLNRRTALLALFSLGTSASISAFAEGGEPKADDPLTTLEAKVTHFLENRGRPNPHIASQNFYPALSRIELNRLLSHAQADIAMRSAWELIRRDGIAQNNVARFLKITSRALTTRPPKWWEETIRTAKLKRNNPKAMEVNAKLFPKYSLHEDWFLPRGQKVRTKNQELQLVVGKHTVPIPAAVTERRKHNEHAECLVGEITEQRAFFVCHSDHDSYVPLHCVDANSGDVVWEAAIWVGASDITRTGFSLPLYRHQSDYAVTLIHDAGRILVFGADRARAHVEGFRDTDGENLFRFCTSI